MNPTVLDYYRQQSAFTDPGDYAPWFDALPDDVPGLVRVVQGLLIPPYRYILSLHGVRPGEIDNAEFGLRSMESTVERILLIHRAPLSEARPPHQRLGVNCRNFATLLVSMLRHKGIPARVRVGFAGYLGGAVYYEHRITEFWDAAQSRWVLVDAWVDDVQREAKTFTSTHWILGQTPRFCYRRMSGRRLANSVLTRPNLATAIPKWGCLSFVTPCFTILTRSIS